jgi:hypothetical protein
MRLEFMTTSTREYIRSVLSLAGLLLLFSHAGCGGHFPSPGPGVFFVAPDGNDAWSGRIATANGAKTDGPFATIPRALQATRQWSASQSSIKKSPAIYVQGGTYFLSAPLTLTPADSGLTLAAYGDQKPVLSGGRRITGWKQVNIDGKQLLAAEIPDARDGKWSFLELWVNGNRAIRARHPNRGYLGVGELPDKTASWTDGHTRFRFREGDLKGWAGATNAELIVMSRWVESRLPITGIDEKERIVTFGKRSVWQLDPGDPYYVEGALELIDQPGEWCLAPGGTVYYLPRPDEKAGNLDAIAPVLVQTLRFEGKPEAGQFVEGVTLQGLTFAHTEWYFAPTAKAADGKVEAGGFSQAAIGVPGSVWGEGLSQCVFKDCSFTHIGNYALELSRGCKSNLIQHCEFSDLGGGGIRLGETSVRDNLAEQTRGNEISDCRVFDGGKLFQSAIGVWLGQTPDNRLVHNEIHDFYYTGISIGWTWGYGKALATNNLVAFNHVHHIGVKSDGDGPILSDMGGIYTLSMQPGTRIVNNLWHDVAGFRYGGWGIYFDEGSSSIVAESNVVYRTTHGGFHQHYGATNFFRNNILAFARDQQVQRSRSEPHISFSFQTNIVYFDQGVLLGSEWKNDKYVMDWNVYFDARPDATPETMKFAGATLEAWRARGHDEHSIVADPLFVAPRQDNFQLQPGSPALKLGFHPIKLETVGPRITSPK